LLKNVRFASGQPLENVEVKSAIKDAEAMLQKSGRLLIRPSGTESLIRVMAEGEDEAMVKKIVEQLCAVIVKAVA
ncbi:MAG: phosphoglucosamine mutase, partial [Pseudomonadota bacterium]|nr:phosphoglucosamine mutase [Pseudomonadota bacterium]